jgi:hypothetical protein
MKGDVPGLFWRDGRPRWVASPSQRRAGLKGLDLKDAEGNWLPLEAAREEAKRLNKKALTTSDVNEQTAERRTRPKKWRPLRVRKPQEDAPSKLVKGYVYAMKFEDKIKIGFSKQPLKRMHEMMTGMPVAPLIIAVPGSMWDEGRLHWSLRRFHLQGEWFSADERVIKRLIKLALGTSTIS